MRASPSIVAVTAFALVALSASAQSGAYLYFTSTPLPMNAGQSFGPHYVQRRYPDGGPMIINQPLTVTVSTSSDAGQFALVPPRYTTSWSAPFTLTIRANEANSDPFHYRDGQVGKPILSATAAGFSPYPQEQTVVPSSMTEDFDSPGLLYYFTPSGPWDEQVIYQSNSVTEIAAAAHRGALGLRVNDYERDADAGPGGEVYLVDLTAPMSGEYHLRTWFRHLNDSDDTDVVILQIVAAGPPARSIADVMLRFSGNRRPRVFLAGFDSAGSYTLDDTGIELPEIEWHLLEVSLQGVGTSNGSRAFRANGVEAAVRSGINWNGQSIGAIHLGEPYAAPTLAFIGDLHFDDFRSAAIPLAQKFAIDAGSTSVAAGRCSPLRLSLVDSKGALAEAPYDVDAVVTANGGPSTLFSDALCSQPVGSPRVAKGTTSAVVFIQPQTAGSTSYLASHVDFLSGGGSVSAATPPTLSLPSTVRAACDAEFRLLPAVGGTPPFTFSLFAGDGGTLPAGLELAKASGELSWRPRQDQAGRYPFVLRLSAPGGVVDAPVSIEVRCEQAVELQVELAEDSRRVAAGGEVTATVRLTSQLQAPLSEVSLAVLGDALSLASAWIGDQRLEARDDRFLLPALPPLAEVAVVVKGYASAAGAEVGSLSAQVHGPSGPVSPQASAAFEISPFELVIGPRCSVAGTLPLVLLALVWAARRRR